MLKRNAPSRRRCGSLAFCSTPSPIGYQHKEAEHPPLTTASTSNANSNRVKTAVSHPTRTLESERIAKGRAMGSALEGGSIYSTTSNPDKVSSHALRAVTASHHNKNSVQPPSRLPARGATARDPAVVLRSRRLPSSDQVAAGDNTETSEKRNRSGSTTITINRTSISSPGTVSRQANSKRSRKSPTKVSTKPGVAGKTVKGRRVKKDPQLTNKIGSAAASHHPDHVVINDDWTNSKGTERSRNPLLRYRTVEGNISSSVGAGATKVSRAGAEGAVVKDDYSDREKRQRKIRAGAAGSEKAREVERNGSTSGPPRSGLGAATTRPRKRSLRTALGESDEISQKLSSTRRPATAIPNPRPLLEVPSSSSMSPAIATSAGALDKAQTVPPAAREENDEAVPLPPCPFLGHPNVSWTCVGCNGARHHLKTRLAMEPLRTMHGFKVCRVPNDGDCFFSSVKAALEGSVDFHPEGMAVEEITVARMRDWWAEETGEEQLAHYSIHAKANPEDRWLDFMRPLDERMPSDVEEDSDGDNEDEDQDEDDGNESALQHAPPLSLPKTRRPRKRAGNSTPQTIAETKPTRVRGGKVSREAGDNQAPRPVRAMGNATATAAPVGAGGSGSDRKTRRRPLEHNGVVGWEHLQKKKTSKETSPYEPSASSSRLRASRRGMSRTEAKKAALDSGGRIEIRKNTRPRRSSGAVPSADTKTTVIGDTCALENGDKSSGGGRGGETEDDGDEGDDEGLPVVRTLDELRSFMRLEGSVVGHGRCMWADTFAHHVVSRRLGVTILFVDMERHKSAWPYRVLATSMEGSKCSKEEERFVVLKREPNHFVLLKTAPPPPPPEVERAPPSPSQVSGDDVGGGTAPPRWGLSCFRRSELPDVVRKLWQI